MNDGWSVWGLQHLSKVPSTSKLALFREMTWCAESSAWDEEADLRDAVRYARGSRLLQIPNGFRDVLPIRL